VDRKGSSLPGVHNTSGTGHRDALITVAYGRRPADEALAAEGDDNLAGDSEGNGERFRAAFVVEHRQAGANDDGDRAGEVAREILGGDRIALRGKGLVQGSEEGGGFPTRGDRRGKLVELRFRNDREIVGAGERVALGRWCLTCEAAVFIEGRIIVCAL
jgi:hypothetical protein